MADKKPAKEDPAPPPAPAGKKKSGLKVIAVVAVLMALEGAGLFFVFRMFGPQESQAAAPPPDVRPDDSELTQELLVVEDKFQNLQTGRVWVWDTSVYVQVKNKNALTVQNMLDRKSAEISEGIGQIISRAQLAQLKEPERQTINRQMSAFLDRLFDTAGGPSPIEKVLIPKCRGFPSDY